MQHKRQGLICEYLHFLVNNVHLVEWVGDSHVRYMYCLVENHLHLLIFKRFYHALYCKKAWDGDNVDDPKEAKEFSGNKAGASDGSKSDKAGDESNITVEVGSELVPKAKGKHKASELVRVAKGRKDGAKCMRTTTGKPVAEVEVKAKPAMKAAAVKTPAKGKTPPKSPSKKK